MQVRRFDGRAVFARIMVAGAFGAEAPATDSGDVMAEWNRKLTGVVVAVVIIVCGVVALALGIVFLQPRSDRIVDCAPGYHNVSGPSSDCVPDTRKSTP